MNRLQRVSNRLRTRRAGDLALLGRAFAALVRARMALAARRGDRTWILDSVPVRPGAIGSVLPVRAAAAVDRLGGILFGRDRCLVKALALRDLLARSGLRTTLRIGARPGRDGLRAHAWLEYEGKVVLGRLPDLAEYTPLQPAF